MSGGRYLVNWARLGQVLPDVLPSSIANLEEEFRVSDAHRQSYVEVRELYRPHPAIRMSCALDSRPGRLFTSAIQTVTDSSSGMRCPSFKNEA